MGGAFAAVSNLRPMERRQPRTAMNVAQHKIINLLKTFWFFAHQFLLVFVYLMCGPRQLFFQYGAAMPKVWTPLFRVSLFIPLYFYVQNLLFWGDAKALRLF